MTTTNHPPRHPARYTPTLLPILAEFLQGRERVLDPFAGTGERLLSIRPDAYLLELEPEWAAVSQAVTNRSFTGDALHATNIFGESFFDAVCTSPVYGNRMCMAGDTLVLTRENGYVPIQRVTTKQHVLTHEGRWKRVLWGGQTGTKQVVQLTAQGPGTLRLTPSHTLPMRHKTRTWNPVQLSDPEWRPASSIVPYNDYLCLATKTPITDETPVPPVGSGDSVWWAVGFWLANGWGYRTLKANGKWARATVCFCKDVAHAAKMEARLYAAFGDHIRRQPHVSGNTVRWFVYSQELLGWLWDNFGQNADGKVIPGWVLDLNDTCRQALLDGWLDGDGCNTMHGGRPMRVGSSINKPMIRMMQTLAHSLGHTARLHRAKTARHEMVAGRMCDVQDAWQLSVYTGKSKRTHRFDDGDYTVIRSVKPISIYQPVYDLEIEDDHSFVAEGVVVHNSDHHEAKDASRRNTYRHALGRPLHPNNAGQLQWGDKYRSFHEQAWQEVRKLLKPDGLFVLNVKDHVRKGTVVPVTEWHICAIIAIGLELVEGRAVVAPGLRQGRNGEARTPHESVLCFQRA